WSSDVCSSDLYDTSSEDISNKATSFLITAKCGQYLSHLYVSIRVYYPFEMLMRLKLQSQTILRNILLPCIRHTLMKSINFVIVGDYQIASELGKKGTTTDLSIYDRKTQDTIFTWTVPITFPDKIQSLMQATNIAEYAILNV